MSKVNVPGRHFPKCFNINKSSIRLRVRELIRRFAFYKCTKAEGKRKQRLGISDPILDNEMVTYDTATLRRVWDCVNVVCYVSFLSSLACVFHVYPRARWLTVLRLRAFVVCIKL